VLRTTRRRTGTHHPLPSHHCGHGACGLVAQCSYLRRFNVTRFIRNSHCCSSWTAWLARLPPVAGRKQYIVPWASHPAVAGDAGQGSHIRSSRRRVRCGHCGIGSYSIKRLRLALRCCHRQKLVAVAQAATDADLSSTGVLLPSLAWLLSLYHVLQLRVLSFFTFP
jgi:hypothetical protein